MPATHALLAMAAVALTMVVTPGPNMLYLVSRTLTQGRRAGFVSLAGIGAGFAVYLVATVAGITALFEAVPALYTVVRVAGAGYLLWLAIQAVRPGGRSVFTPRPLPVDGDRRLFAMGLLTLLLNPKVAVLYLSLLPQFVDPSRGSVAVQGLVLGAVQTVISLTVNGCIVLTAGSVARWLAGRPAWLRTQRLLMGGVLGALALRIVTEPRTLA